MQDSLGEKLNLPKYFQALVKEFTAAIALAALVHRLVPDAPKELARPVAPARPASPSCDYDDRGGRYTNQGGGSASGSVFIGMGDEDGVQPDYRGRDVVVREDRGPVAPR